VQRVAQQRRYALARRAKRTPAQRLIGCLDGAADGSGKPGRWDGRPGRGEDGVIRAIRMPAGPTELDLEAGLGRNPVNVLRVDAAARGRPGVRDAGDADRAVATQQTAQHLLGADLARPVGPVRERNLGLAADVQQHVVPELAHLVDVPAAPGQHARRGDAGDVRAELAGEGCGVDQQFDLLGRTAPGADRQAGVIARGGLDGERERVEQSQVPDVAEVDDTARSGMRHGAAQHVAEIFDGREVLDDGVEHDGIELLRGRQREIGRGRRDQLDVVETGLPHGGAERIERGGGEVDTHVPAAVRGDAPENETTAAADLQDPLGPVTEHTVDRRVDPLAHLLGRDALAGVAADPACGVESGVVLLRTTLDRVEHVLPGLLVHRCVAVGDRLLVVPP
jgi:hypothetical protein